MCRFSRPVCAGSYRCGRTLWALGAMALAWTSIASADSVLDRIAQRQAIVLGYTVSSPPMSYLSPDGTPIGYTIDICRAIAGRIGAKLGNPALGVRFLRMELDTRAGLIREGSVDLLCNGTSNTAEHREAFEFGPTIYVAETRLVTKADSSVQSIADLADAKVAVSVGSTAESTLQSIAYERGLDVVVARSNDAAFDQLLLGWAKAFALDDVVLGGLIATLPQSRSYRMLPDILAREAIGIAFVRGDGALDRIVTDAVTGLMASGELAKLYAKWFESPVPPHGVTIGKPMSEELKSLIAAPSDQPIH